MANARGEDRSNFQAVRSWAGLDFGGCKATEGLTFIDHTFINNWAALRNTGIPRIAYHFGHPAIDPRAQALFFYGVVSAAGLHKGDILALDIEITAGVAATTPRSLMDKVRGVVTTLPRQNLPVKIRGLTAGSVNSWAKVFMDTLQGIAGPHVKVICYTNKSVGSTLGGCTGYPLWIAFFAASPPASVSPWHDYLIWQNGRTGPGGGDANLWHGDKAEMKAYVAKFAGGTPVPPPHVAKEIPEPMELHTGAGARTAVAVQDGAKLMRFSTLAGTTAKLTVSWGESGTPVPVSVSGHAAATTVKGDAATIIRTDAGANPVSVVVF